MDDPHIHAALIDLKRAGEAVQADWALIGGQALQVHGVPRHTLDTDALVDSDKIGAVADLLVGVFQWTPLRYDDRKKGYVRAKKVTFHQMDDPILFDISEERQMIPFRTPSGVLVELLAAQHPIERRMIRDAELRKHHTASIPVAPLGGILLVKTKADRAKDRAAIEQATEHLSGDTLKAAVAWAKRSDPSSAEDLSALIKAVQVRRNPIRTRTRPAGKKDR